MSTSDPSERPLLQIAADDPGLDRRLRQDLTTLRDRSAGTELAALLDDVLAGRRSLRDAARTQAFNEAVAPAAQKMARQWSQLGAAERDALIERGRRQLEADRIAGARRPDGSRPWSPDQGRAPGA